MDCLLWRTCRVALLASWIWLVIVIAVPHAEALTGNEWKRMGEFARQFYVVGVVDAWASVASIQKEFPVSGAGVLSRLARCAFEREMTYAQMAAIVEKYMANHPENWHRAMSWLVWEAMNDACTDFEG